MGNVILLSHTACLKQYHADICVFIQMRSYLYGSMYVIVYMHVCVGGDVAESELPASRGSRQSWRHFYFTKRRGTVVHQHGQQWTGANTHISYVLS